MATPDKDEWLQAALGIERALFAPGGIPQAAIDAAAMIMEGANAAAAKKSGGAAGGANKSATKKLTLAAPKPIKVPPSDRPPSHEETKAPAKAKEAAKPPAADAGTPDTTAPSKSGDDDAHAGVDTQVGYTGKLAGGGMKPAPFSLQVTLLYRDFKIKSLRDGQLEFLKEPGISLQFDSQGQVTAQLGATLVDAHWMPPWRHEIEASLQAFVAEQGGQFSGGAALQFEQHITKDGISVVLSATGTEGPAASGHGSELQVTGTVGLVFHLTFEKKEEKDGKN